ncbi:hypothetical protein C5L30_001320 [Companilactobacillus farciminis]|uniref:WxL Interacting Protein host binding domain-containing protein n=1 Tax=Companilactobacillus farciminis TaxID=1612 RepID=A0A4V3A3A3_9LACO|nr:DUF3324 domain-containing protein [Companilactobacillus farciminis]ATO45719.1 hypothetical protein LF20184_02620 [Companilactobacillus farciminis KCTC 3681 = DSM 20184]KRK62346.1 hypothetical protein FC68_GL002145 [Companilactobacillus farciminis KCTC 3681 = DSM 20184]TDG73828.1 hypothetical protein C5L30_001320 [Companilactobacillus farciminis]
MKKRMRTRKSLNVKKRVVGFFAIAVILLGVIGGFGLTHVIAESNSTTGGGADRSAPVAVVASKSDDTESSLGGGGGGSNGSVLINSDNTGTSTGTEAKTKDTDFVPSVNINNMSSYPQTGDAHDRFNLGPKTMSADLTYPKVAPNSRIPVDFDQNTTPIQAGKYVVKGAARSGKATWTFHKTYTITQDQANDINKRCKGLIYNKTTTYILIVCVLVSLIFLIFWAIWHSGRS